MRNFCELHQVRGVASPLEGSRMGGADLHSVQ